MTLNTSIGFFHLFVTLCYSQNPVRVSILVMFSGDGYLSFISDTHRISKHWETHLLERSHSVSSWPFDASIEYCNVHSDPDITRTLLEARLHNKSMPNVSVIIGPETHGLGYIVAALAADHGIPVIFPVFSADISHAVQPSILRTSFLIQPPEIYQFRTLLDLYDACGVQTLVAVSYTSQSDPYNQNTCFGTADLALSRGVRVLERISFTLSNTTDDMLRIVEHIRDNLNPDAVIWCHSASCATDGIVQNYNPLQYFKRAQYLPKALGVLDCLDQPAVKTYYDQGLYQFVSSGQFINDKLNGADYTEDSTVYSSSFRPVTPPNLTVRDITWLK